MSYTTWLVILAVIALCVGPVMMFKPSARDRRLAMLRSDAIARGARISLGSGSAAGYTRYLMPWQQRRQTRDFWRLVRKDYSHELHLAGVWSTEQGEPGTGDKVWLEPALAELPASVALVESAPDGVALYWNESGPGAALVQIIDWLERAAAR